VLRCEEGPLFCVVEAGQGALDGSSCACRDSSGIVVGFVGEGLAGV